MFRIVVKISVLSILNFSETIKREEKVYDVISIVMNGTLVSFFSVKMI